jgi:hypothetical protein
VAPPDFLFKSIMSKIEGDDMDFKNTFKPLFAHAVMPNAAATSFGSIMNRIKQSDELATLKPLKDFEVKAPISFVRLMEIIRALVSNQVAAPSAGKLVSFSSYRKIAAAAAAVLLLIGSSYFIYQKNTSTNISEKIAIVPSPSLVTPNTSPIIVPIMDSASVEKNTQTLAQNVERTNRTGVRKINGVRKFGKGLNDTAFIADGIPMTEMKINGGSFSIIDNDYLVTFTSFNEANLPLFLQADKPVATSITVDNYTDITISEGMGAMMKKMYKTKKSGKPTRRARKQREKLDKWKKADADYFNNNSTSNPLDPMDLGNFILSK